MRIGTSASTKRLDEACTNEYKIPLIVLMENVVLSAMNHLDVNSYSNYVIVSGVGNNGGDGLGIARQLVARNKKVRVFIVGNIEKMTSCSKINYEILKSMNIDTQIIDSKETDRRILDCFKNFVKQSDVVIDCIFGTGLEREVKGVFKEVIEIINKNKTLTYSIDVPSGIDATNGEVLGICKSR